MARTDTFEGLSEFLAVADVADAAAARPACVGPAAA
jgi:hypothetical protein